MVGATRFRCHYRAQWLFVLVDNDEGGDDAGHPAASSQQEHNQNTSTTPVQDGKWRKNNTQQYLQQGHAIKESKNGVVY